MPSPLRVLAVLATSAVLLTPMTLAIDHSGANFGGLRNVRGASRRPQPPAPDAPFVPEKPPPNTHVTIFKVGASDKGFAWYQILQACSIVARREVDPGVKDDMMRVGLFQQDKAGNQWLAFCHVHDAHGKLWDLTNDAAETFNNVKG